MGVRPWSGLHERSRRLEVSLFAKRGYHRAQPGVGMTLLRLSYLVKIASIRMLVGQSDCDTKRSSEDYFCHQGEDVFSGLLLLEQKAWIEWQVYDQPLPLSKHVRLWRQKAVWNFVQNLPGLKKRGETVDLTPPSTHTHTHSLSQSLSFSLSLARSPSLSHTHLTHAHTGTQLYTCSCKGPSWSTTSARIKTLVEGFVSRNLKTQKLACVWHFKWFIGVSAFALYSGYGRGNLHMKGVIYC